MKSIGLGSTLKQRFRSPTRDLAADERRRRELAQVVERIRAEIDAEHLGLARRLEELRPTSSYLFGSVPGPVDTSEECRVGVARAARLHAQLGVVDEIAAAIERGFAPAPAGGGGDGAA